MSKFIAKSISFALSPPIILIPVPFLLVLKDSNNIFLAIKWSLFFYIFLLVMILLVFGGRFFGIFSDLDVSKKSERPKLLYTAIAISVINLVLLLSLNAPKILVLLGIGLTIGLVLILGILKWTKMSIHTAAISAFALSITIVYGKIFSPLLVLIPIMGWARVASGRHSLKEVIAGGTLGSLLTIIIYGVGKIIYE